MATPPIDKRHSASASIATPPPSGLPDGQPVSSVEREAFVAHFDTERSGASSADMPFTLWRVLCGEADFEIPEEFLIGRVSPTLLRSFFHLTDEQVDAVLKVLFDLHIISSSQEPSNVRLFNRDHLNAFLYAHSLLELSIPPDMMIRLAHFLQRTGDQIQFKNLVNFHGDDYSSKILDFTGFNERLNLSPDESRDLLEFLFRYLTGEPIEFRPETVFILWMFCDYYLLSNLQEEIKAFILSSLFLHRVYTEDFKNSNIPDSLKDFFRSAIEIDHLIEGDIAILKDYLINNQNPQTFSLVVNRLLFYYHRDEHHALLYQNIMQLLRSLTEPHRTEFLMMTILRSASVRPDVVFSLCVRLPAERITLDFIHEVALCALPNNGAMQILCDDFPENQISPEVIRVVLQWIPPQPFVLSYLCKRLPRAQITLDLIRDIAPVDDRLVRLLCGNISPDLITLDTLRSVSQWNPPLPLVLSYLSERLPHNLVTLDVLQQIVSLEPYNPNFVYYLCLRLPKDQIKLEFIRYAATHWGEAYQRPVVTLCSCILPEEITPEFILEAVTWQPSNPIAVSELCANLLHERITDDFCHEIQGWPSEYSAARDLILIRILSPDPA